MLSLRSVKSKNFYKVIDPKRHPTEAVYSITLRCAAQESETPTGFRFVIICY